MRTHNPQATADLVRAIRRTLWDLDTIRQSIAAIKSGADIDVIVDEAKRCTPLHWANNSSFTHQLDEYVKEINIALLVRGANLHILDAEGISPFFAACLGIRPALLPLIAWTEAEFINRVGRRSSDGINETPLSRAMFPGSNEIMSSKNTEAFPALLAKNADPFLVSPRKRAQYLTRTITEAPRIATAENVLRGLELLALKGAILIAPDGAQVMVMNQDGSVATVDEGGHAIDLIAAHEEFRGSLAIASRLAYAVKQYCRLTEFSLTSAAAAASSKDELEAATTRIVGFLSTGRIKPLADPAEAALSAGNARASCRAVTSHLMITNPARTSELLLKRVLDPNSLIAHPAAEGVIDACCLGQLYPMLLPDKTSTVVKTTLYLGEKIPLEVAGLIGDPNFNLKPLEATTLRMMAANPAVSRAFFDKIIELGIAKLKIPLTLDGAVRRIQTSAQILCGTAEPFRAISDILEKREEVASAAPSTAPKPRGDILRSPAAIHEDDQQSR